MTKFTILKSVKNRHHIYLAMENFGEEVLGKKERELQSKEKPVNAPDAPAAEIVDEKVLQAKIDAINEKIAKSPVAEKYKEGMRRELQIILGHAEKALTSANTDTKEELDRYVQMLEESLDAFHKIPDVKQVYEVIEPFFAKEKEVLAVINLQTYESGSGDWVKINEQLAQLGIDQTKVEALQRHLKIKPDGKVGPKTIEAVGSMLGVKIDVKFAEKTEKAKKAPEPIAAEAKPKTPASEPLVAEAQPKIAAPKVPEPQPKETAKQAPKKAKNQLRSAENAPEGDREIAQLKLKAKEKTEDLARLQKVKHTIDTQVLPFHRANLEKYMKENSMWSSFDEEGALRETINEISKNEQKIAKLDSQMNGLTAEINTIYGKIFTKQHADLKAGGVNTEQFLLMVDSQMGAGAPAGLKDAIKAVKDKAINDTNIPEVQRLILQGKYSQALAKLGQQNKEMTKFGGTLTATDIAGSYNQALSDTSLQSNQFKPDSFGAKKLAEGYTSFKISKYKTSSQAVYGLAKANKDGSISFSVVDTEGRDTIPEAMLKGNNITISAKEIGESGQKTEELRENMLTAISQNPNIKEIQKNGEFLQSKFVPMQRILMAGLEGGKTGDVVAKARNYAREVQQFDFYKLRRNLDQARADLKLLKSFPAGVKDEFEGQIKDMEQALRGITDMVEGQKIENFCRHILDEEEFNEDNFKNWFMREGIVMLSAIVVATAAVVLLVGSGGTGAPAAILMLAKAAAIGTAAGMVGAELAHAGLEAAAVAQGKEFKNRSLLGKYVMEQGDLDVRTGGHTYVTGKEVATDYLKQFAVGTATTFITMGLGKGAGKLLSRFANNHAVSKGIVGALARTVSKIPKLKPQQVDVLEKKGLRAILEKIGEETFEEIGEEIAQGTAEEIDRKINAEFDTKFAPFAAMVNFYTSLSGNEIHHTAGSFKLAANSVQTISGPAGVRVLSDYNYDVTKTTELFADLQENYANQPGFKIENGQNGEILVTNEINTKKGKYTNVVTLRPTAQSIEIGRLLSNVGGQSELASLYGVQSSGDNVCTYDNLKPKGKIDLVKYLKRKGFKIEGDPLKGEFTAIKGDEQIIFKQSTSSKPKPPESGPKDGGPGGGGGAPEQGEEEKGRSVLPDDLPAPADLPAPKTNPKDKHYRSVRRSEAPLAEEQRPRPERPKSRGPEFDRGETGKAVEQGPSDPRAKIAVGESSVAEPSVSAKPQPQIATSREISTVARLATPDFLSQIHALDLTDPQNLQMLAELSPANIDSQVALAQNLETARQLFGLLPDSELGKQFDRGTTTQKQKIIRDQNAKIGKKVHPDTDLGRMNTDVANSLFNLFRVSRITLDNSLDPNFKESTQGDQLSTGTQGELPAQSSAAKAGVPETPSVKTGSIHESSSETTTNDSPLELDSQFLSETAEETLSPEQRREQKLREEAERKAQPKTQAEERLPATTANLLSMNEESVTTLANRMKNNANNDDQILAARELFGITGDLHRREINNIYFELSKQTHPDRLKNGTSEAKSLAAEKYKLITRAKDILMKGAGFKKPSQAPKIPQPAIIKETPVNTRQSGEVNQEAPPVLDSSFISEIPAEPAVETKTETKKKPEPIATEVAQESVQTQAQESLPKAQEQTQATKHAKAEAKKVEKAPQEALKPEKDIFESKLVPGKSYEYKLKKGQSINIEVGNVGTQINAINEKGILIIRTAHNHREIARVKPGEKISIGRKAITTIDLTISANHLEISFDQSGKISIKDLDSKNGTKVSKVEVKKKSAKEVYQSVSEKAARYKQKVETKLQSLKFERQYKKLGFKTGDQVIIENNPGDFEVWQVADAKPDTDGDILLTSMTETVDGTSTLKIRPGKILEYNTKGPLKTAEQAAREIHFPIGKTVEIKMTDGSIIDFKVNQHNSDGTFDIKSGDTVYNYKFEELVAWEQQAQKRFQEASETQAQKNTARVAEFDNALGVSVEINPDSNPDSRRNTEKKEYSEVQRETDVFYIPDIHGDAQALHNSLTNLGVVDNQGNWIGGNKVIQFSGDYIDRGKTNLQTLDYVKDIKVQAEAAGGRIDLLMGNHEALLVGTVLGDASLQAIWFNNGGLEVLREIAVKNGLNNAAFEQKLADIKQNKGDVDGTPYCAEFDAAMVELRNSFLQEGGEYYDLFHSMKPASQVDDVLYVHAGVSPKWALLINKYGVDGINQIWTQALERAKQGDMSLFKQFNEIGGGRGGTAENGGLFWIDFEEELATMSDNDVAVISENLKAKGINAIVVGHSRVDNPRILANFEAHGIKLISTDVGMSDAYHRDSAGQGESGVGGARIDTNGTIAVQNHDQNVVLHEQRPILETPEQRAKALEADFQSLTKPDGTDTPFEYKLANLLIPQIFAPGTVLTLVGKSEIVEKIETSPGLFGWGEFKITCKNGLKFNLSGGDAANYIYSTNPLNSSKSNEALQKFKSLYEHNLRMSGGSLPQRLGGMEGTGAKRGNPALDFTRTRGITPTERAKKVWENPATQAREILFTDPRTNQPYEKYQPDPNLSDEQNAEKAREYKHNQRREVIDYIRTSYKNQAKILSNIAKSVYAELEKNPNIGPLQLTEKYLNAQVQQMLSPDQAMRAENEIYPMTERMKVVQKYLPMIQHSPIAFAEKIFGLEPGTLQGPITVTSKAGVINFIATNQADYSQMYHEGRQLSLTESDRSNGSVGFAAQRSHIVELTGAITVSKNDGTDILDHEHQHQMNRFIFAEKADIDSKPIVRAKDEIISFLRDGSSSKDIKNFLTDDNGLYHYFKSELKQAKTPEERAKIEKKWEAHKRDVVKLVDIAAQILTPDGKIDLELLAVTPVEQWKLFLPEKSAQVLPFRRTKRHDESQQMAAAAAASTPREIPRTQNHFGKLAKKSVNKYDLKPGETIVVELGPKAKVTVTLSRDGQTLHLREKGREIAKLSKGHLWDLGDQDIQNQEKRQVGREHARISFTKNGEILVMDNGISTGTSVAQNNTAKAPAPSASASTEVPNNTEKPRIISPPKVRPGQASRKAASARPNEQAPAKAAESADRIVKRVGSVEKAAIHREYLAKIDQSQGEISASQKYNANTVIDNPPKNLETWQTAKMPINSFLLLMKEEGNWGVPKIDNQDQLGSPNNFNNLPTNEAQRFGFYDAHERATSLLRRACLNSIGKKYGPSRPENRVSALNHIYLDFQSMNMLVSLMNDGQSSLYQWNGDKVEINTNLINAAAELITSNPQDRQTIIQSNPANLPLNSPPSPFFMGAAQDAKPKPLASRTTRPSGNHQSPPRTPSRQSSIPKKKARISNTIVAEVKKIPNESLKSKLTDILRKISSSKTSEISVFKKIAKSYLSIRNEIKNYSEKILFAFDLKITEMASQCNDFTTALGLLPQSMILAWRIRNVQKPESVEPKLWKAFIRDVEQVRSLYGNKYADLLLDLDSKFSDIDGTNLDNIEKRRAYAKSLLKTKEFEQTYFQWNKKQPALSKRIMEEKAFRVEKVVKIGDKTFYIGPIHKYSTKVDGVVDERLEAIMFVDTGNGTVLPRILYKSNSQGRWKSTPGVTERGNISKGAHLPGVYTQATNLAPELSDYFDAAELSNDPLTTRVDLIYKYLPYSDSSRNEIDSFSREVFPVRKSDDLSGFNLPGYSPGNFKGQNATHEIRNMNIHFNNFPGFIPDFRKQPLSVKQKVHPVLGQCTIETYKGIYKGREVQWEIGHDVVNRVWVEDIRFTDQQISSYGTNTELIVSGIITSKPLEYSQFTEGLIEGREKYTLQATQDNVAMYYSDVTPLLDNLLPIQSYRRARGIWMDRHFPGR